MDGTSHMWNAVRLDSGVRHVDITWADALGAPGSADWLTYFMRTEDEISAGRTIIGETLHVYEKEHLS